MLLALAILVITPEGWQLPETASQVQVLRGGTTAWVAPSEVLPSERIRACNSDLPVGSRQNCPTSPAWWLKSEVFVPAAPKGFPLHFRWSDPDKNTDGTLLNDLVGYNAYVQRQDCDPLNSTCPVAAWSEPIWIGNVNEYTVEDCIFRCCLRVQPVNEPKAIAGLSNEACGPLKIPAAVTDLRLE